MHPFFRRLAFIVVLSASTEVATAQQTATVNGRVMDAAENLPLTGANVVLLEGEGGPMVTGGATDVDGRYSIAGIAPGSYTLAFRFIGYQEVTRSLTLAAGETFTVDIALRPVGLDLNAIVVSASRQAEKVLDAPASISVLDVREIESYVVPSSAAILRNTTGVDMAQTGVDRYEIVLRGFNNAFSGATYVMTDYRQGAIASLGVNAYQMMPITQIDLDRIEVVRGPGSALYGAGVDAGVIHFITKDPFQHPGTTVSVGGGTRDMFLFSGRHAGVVNDRLGYKVVGNFSRAEDWNFDPKDRLDSLQLASFRPEALPVDYENYKYGATGTLVYRWRPNVNLTANGGFMSSKSIFLSGIGTLQSEGFGYTFGQLRLDAAGFFAQAYVNMNNAGDSFVYRATAIEEVVDNSILFNAQTQYNFRLMEDRLRVVAGADYELTMPDTEGTINGRNEDDDQIQEIGAYMQGSAALHPKLDATVALRADHNNVVDEVQISPRAALVFKPNTAHSFRATFNRAFSSPGTNSLFLDINAGSAGPLTIRARGAATGYDFEELSSGGYQASSLLTYNFGRSTYLDGSLFTSEEMLLGPLYGAVYAGLQGSLTDPAQLPAPLNQLSAEQLGQLVQLLNPSLTPVSGSVDATMGYVNLSSGQIDRFTTSLTDIAPLKQTISQTYEVGYKGLMGNKVLIEVDGYYVQKKNFIGPLAMETPFVLVPAIRADFQASVASGILNNPQLMGALRQLQQNGLLPSNVPVEVAAASLLLDLAASQSGSLAGLFAGRSPLSNTYSPIGIVQPEGGSIPGQLLLSYRNYGTIDYVGVDVSTQVLVSDNLTLFGNISWLNDNFFDSEELGEEGSTLELSMNAPKTKLKAGFDYTAPAGWRATASVRHTGEFIVRSGPYEGIVDAQTMLDLGAGYAFDPYVPGLRLDVSVLNVLDDRQRQFIGAPQIGRLAIARLTYTM